MTLAQLTELLDEPEDEHLEFKEARNNYSFDKLKAYAIAFANDGGGTLILGVTDQKPRRVVGTSAFGNLPEAKQRLTELLHLRVNAEAIAHPDGRVVAVTFPGRPLGRPLHLDGVYLMRSGESLVPMAANQLKAIFEEAEDCTAEPCPQAVVADLDPAAVQLFREGIIRRAEAQAQKDRYAAMPFPQLLRDVQLMNSAGYLTKAAIVLLGSEATVGRWAPNAEIVIEYRAPARLTPYWLEP